MIPASQRADGTWRKERKIRDGYVPQEEVPKYESKGRKLAKLQEQQQAQCPPGYTPIQLTPSITTYAVSPDVTIRPVVPRISGLTIEPALPVIKAKRKRRSKKSKTPVTESAAAIVDTITITLVPPPTQLSTVSKQKPKKVKKDKADKIDENVKVETNKAQRSKIGK